MGSGDQTLHCKTIPLAVFDVQGFPYDEQTKVCGWIIQAKPLGKARKFKIKLELLMWVNSQVS